MICRSLGEWQASHCFKASSVRFSSVAYGIGITLPDGVLYLRSSRRKAPSVHRFLVGRPSEPVLEPGFSLCSARLQAGICPIPKCPPEGGRYITLPIPSSHTDSSASRFSIFSSSTARRKTVGRPDPVEVDSNFTGAVRPSQAKLQIKRKRTHGDSRHRRHRLHRQRNRRAPAR